MARTQTALKALLDRGELRISPEAEPFNGYRRTSFIGRLLPSSTGLRC